jgi:hypothetical protein
MTKVRRGEEVSRDARRAMTPARKRRIHQMRGGVCGDCGDPVPVDGPGVVYDHRIALWIKGSDADEAFWPLCEGCNDKKTNGKGGDLSTIAKIKRIQKKHGGETQPSKRPIKSRGFDKRFRKKLGGQVERIENRAEHHDED